jgi:hypothetical protein
LGCAAQLNREFLVKLLSFGKVIKWYICHICVCEIWKFWEFLPTTACNAAACDLKVSPIRSTKCQRPLASWNQPGGMAET